MNALCPCGSKQDYQTCCGKFIDDDILPTTPEQLMRSRYSAYTQAKVDYIAKTMCGPAAVGFDINDASTWAKQVKWLNLTVLNTSLKDDLAGKVEFLACFIAPDHKIHAIHEISDFEKIDGRWFYVDGKQINERPIKIGSNDLCPCGSGKKYKKCCGK